jgi:hypothetical protein
LIAPNRDGRLSLRLQSFEGPNPFAESGPLFTELAVRRQRISAFADRFLSIASDVESRQR